MNRRADLVLEGGGVKGIAHVGAATALLDRGWAVERVAAASAGSVVASLLAAGAGPEELRRYVAGAPYRSFADRGGLLGRVPLLGPLLSLLVEDGVYEGEVLRRYVAERLADHGVTTFGDLRRDDAGDDPGPGAEVGLPQDRGYRLVVVVADITRGLLVRLPWDYRRLYGLDPDTQLVADAVRASTALPYAYEPARLCAADGRESLLVDGGVLSNFPIDTFDRTDGQPPRWPSIGVKLSSDLPEDRARLSRRFGFTRGPLYFTELLVSTLVVGRDQTRLTLPGVRERTVLVDTAGVGVLEFDLDAAQRSALLRAGSEAMVEFLDARGADLR